MLAHTIHLEYSLDMRHKKDLIEGVKKLRSKGKTYTDIRNILNVKIPQSTLTSWCRNIVMPHWYKSKIEKLNIENRRKGRNAVVLMKKIQMQNLLNQLHLTNLYLLKKFKDKDIKKMLLSMLYLGEGAKWKSHRGLYLGSSDPKIIQLYMHLLSACYNIGTQKIKARISYRADQNLNYLQKFWSRITSIPIKNFYKTKPDPRTIGRVTKNKDYMGVCCLTCAGTKMQLELDVIAKILHMGV